MEDEDVGEVVDGGFVAVKADREKRPDIDAVFMAATTALTGHGGWPMTCFLTPDGEPLYCGAHSQLPAVLEAVSQAWTSQPDHVLATSGLGHLAAARATRTRCRAGPPTPTSSPARWKLRCSGRAARGGSAGLRGLEERAEDAPGR